MPESVGEDRFQNLLLGHSEKPHQASAARCEPQEPLRDPAFPFPPLQRITSHIHVRHGMSLHHVLHTASLENLKIKNVANHKYLKSPGAGMCTVFKQSFLIWYLFFLQQQHASAKFFFSFFFHFPSLATESFTLLWHSRSRTSQIPFAQLHRQEGRLQPPLSIFFLPGFCLSVW